ncbi:MAG TPA: PilZ domain-containing protein [Thermoanaerobaculia bacterium]|nr:PilZ domain-containing protein [Thermoanaerobaculia bacterium]
MNFMSALEQGSIDPSERRAAPRLRVAHVIQAFIGRGSGTLIDLSERGARIRHSTMVRRGAVVRVSFEWQRARFSASAEVLASRVVCLGDEHRPTSYESRLRFLHVSDGAHQVLEKTLDALAGRDVRRWVANLRGWHDETVRETPPVPATATFLRCRLFGIRWEVKRTSDVEQPEDGFLVPSTIDDNEIVKLCADYVRADTDGRRVMRLIAAASVEEAIAARRVTRW